MEANNSKVVFAFDVSDAKKRKMKSPFSELVADGPRGLSDEEFDAKLKSYREQREKRISAGRYM